MSPIRKWPGLEPEIEKLDAELRSRAGLNTTLGGANPEWASQALGMLDCARKSVASGDSSEGWEYLKTARRLMIFGLDAVSVETAAIALRLEAANVLHGWQQTAVLELLDDEVRGSDPPASRMEPRTADEGEVKRRREALWMATVIRDQADASSLRVRDRRIHWWTVGVSMVAVILTVIALLATLGVIGFREPLAGPKLAGERGFAAAMADTAPEHTFDNFLKVSWDLLPATAPGEEPKLTVHIKAGGEEVGHLLFTPSATQSQVTYSSSFGQDSVVGIIRVAFNADGTSGQILGSLVWTNASKTSSHNGLIGTF